MLVRLLSVTLMLIGTAGFLLPFWIGYVVKDVGALEVPLIDIGDVAVSADHRLFFALSSMGRIQVYSPEGRFLRNFAVQAGGGRFCIELSRDRLSAYFARRNTFDEFDLEGRLVRSNVPVDASSNSTACGFDRAVGLQRSFTSVVVSFAGGARPPITIERRWWHYPALGPLVSWTIIALGLMLWPEWLRNLYKSPRGSPSG